MPAKPNITAQLTSQMGMGRPGGMASRGSTAVAPSTGGKFAAMENTLLKTMKPNPAKLAKGKGGRMFKKAGAEKFGQT